jgi:hypothetical protein
MCPHGLTDIASGAQESSASADSQARRSAGRVFTKDDCSEGKRCDKVNRNLEFPREIESF